MSSSDALQDMINGEELSLYGTAPNNAQSAQVNNVLCRLFCYDI